MPPHKNRTLENENQVMCGLEIHQQLNTKKLFCDCSSVIVKDFSNATTFERMLSLSESEIGSIDPAALHEFKRKRKFRYIAPAVSSCLVEMDEEPPHEINKEALIIALQAAKLFNAQPVDELHVMRKIVIDGSNTTGFQRTALVAMNGLVDVNSKAVPIQTICLEEDAARKVEEKEGIVTYCLDRLGIPLLEITTGPVISNGKEARKVAEKIGLLLRSLNVMRGIGTIRQDINISVKGGNRIEIKGAQDLRSIEKLVDLEIIRQKKLIEFKTKAPNPKFGALTDITPIFKETKSNIVKKSIRSGKKVFGFKITNFKGFLGYELYQNKRIATEISDYIKVKSKIKGFLHGDELPGYGITDKELQRIKNTLDIEEKDNFVIFLGDQQHVEEAYSLFKERLHQLLDGVPKEVRKANQDGTTTFMRPLPGAARMYPETDIRPIILKHLEVETPKSIFDVIEEYKKMGLSEDIAKIAAKEKIDLKEFVDKYKLKPTLIARLIIETPKMLRSKIGKDVILSEEKIHELLELFSKGKLTRRGVELLLENYALTSSWNPKKYLALSKDQVAKLIEDLLKKTTNKKEILRELSKNPGVDLKLAVKILEEKVE